MRIILINPPLDSVIRDGHVDPVTSYLFYNSAPLGLLYIAAVLERRGDTVACVDAAAELLDIPRTVQRIVDFAPDIIGIGSTTVVFDGAVELAKRLKEALPAVPVVLGGYHVTLLPEEAMQHGCFDVGVIHEGEHTMLELVEHYEGQRALEDIEGIVYRRDDGAVHHTPHRKTFRKLDELPFPARHLLPPNLYKPVPVDEHAMPKFAMVTSRGCPHACAFCQKSRTGYRSRSPVAVVDEIEHLVRDFGVRDIAFVDSLFCANKRRVMAICDEIIRRGVKVSWTCSSRVEVVDKEMLQRMKDAGCWRTRFGIESGSDQVLDFISKGITKEKIRNAITWAHEVGLRPKAFFMVGHMPDTHETIQETINFAKSIPLHDVTVQINTLLPRTPQMEIWEREGEKWGRVINETTSEKSFWEPTFVPWGLEPDDLIRYHRQFYREFYFRPVTLARHLEGIESWRDVAKYVQASNLFSFLFYNAEKPSLGMVRNFVKTMVKGGEAQARAEAHEYVG
ncbi:MAG: cobalamin B12-binding domain-containing protein [Alphaproteobacteria bacterium]|nr:cobalamin B12-binding domain-containing protein [Alphaproteobacteria bacterium]